MEVDGPATPPVGQDAAIDTTSLPADQAPKFWAEAMRLYEHSRPPFVGASGSYPHGSRRAVFIAENGQRPHRPIRTDLVALQWSRREGVYWTLDLNGERYIVQVFPNNYSVVGVGARWVYRYWTGVGDEFEETPLAFSCSNGAYIDTSGTKTKSTPISHQPTARKNPSINATANSTRLHENHPVEYLEEAKVLYEGTRPPFVILKTQKPRRRVLLALQDGNFSADSTESEVVYREWDSMNDYPTLDLDGKRFIVWGNAGRYPGGYRYHLWLGRKTGRVQKVAAFSYLHADARETTSGLTKHPPEIEDGSSSSSDDEEDQDSVTEYRRYSYDIFKRGFDVTVLPSPTPSKFSSGLTVASSEPSARKDSPPRKLKPTKRARDSTPPEHFSSMKDPAPAHNPKRISRQSGYASEDSSDLSSPSDEISEPVSSLNDRPAPAPPASGNQTHQGQVSSSLPTLTHYKQTHTTLRATRDSTIIGFVPLRLVTCMTMSTLFSSVIAASGHRENEEPINCLMAVFDWKDDADLYKTIYIDRGTEGSFEIFLEIIDEAPCWGNEGRCGIAIEIVRA